MAAKPATLAKQALTAVKVKFYGGCGGDGCISMFKFFANEFGGPSGGDGGNGGHVVLRSSRKVADFNGMQSVYRASNGVRGRGKTMHGANAPHLFVDVPIGTLVVSTKPKGLPDKEFNPNTSDIIAELDEEGSLFLAARGGAGGRGNAYYLSNQNRKPRIAQVGAKGETNYFELRLQQID